MDPRQCLFSVALVLLATTCIHVQMRPIKIGAIFHKGEEDLQSVFLRAIFDIKYENLAPAFELIPVIKYIEGNTNSFMTAVAGKYAVKPIIPGNDYSVMLTTCELLEKGVAAIFGPSSRYTSGIVASIAARFHIPHIEYVWRESKRKENEKRKNSSSMTINIFPASEQVSQAIADIIDSMGWQKFAAIYETDEGLSRLQKTLTLKGDKDNPIIHTVRQLNEGLDYRAMLKEIRYLPVCNIIIDVKPENIMEVLRQAKEVRLLADYCNFVITYLYSDSSELPIAAMQNGIVNITGLSIRENYDIEEIDWLDSAVLYDAVFLLYKTLETLNARNIENKVHMSIDPIPLSCIDKTTTYEAGPNIVSVMQEISKRGKITGNMHIDEFGRRQDFNINILNFWQSGTIQSRLIGYWDFDGIHVSQIEKEGNENLHRLIREKIFKISVKINTPYIMVVTDGSSRGILIDQKRYEGYCIDLINHIAAILRFKGVLFQLVTDGRYGTYDQQTKTWNGLIKSILDHEADLAISDLTITSYRKSAVDFSLPFMTSGFSIVFSKPEKKKIPFFPFLLPLSTEVWFYMATAYLVVSIMLFLQARMTPDEWDNPHPCNAEPKELENNFNLKNSCWLTIGSLMQRGSNILPKAPSLRMLASMWWFFTLIMYSSYTANLAAFLTMEKMDIPIKGIEDLPKQTKIRYGALENSSTAAFFKNSNYATYKQIWTVMSNARPSVFASTYEEGIERVIKGRRQYAFLMETAAIEYNVERKCDIIKIGNAIENRGYGIAMPRNSPYRIPINNAILTLREKGVLLALKKKWWQEIGGGLCIEDEVEKEATFELRMVSLEGVFFVLMCGCGASFFIAICEFLWNIRKVAVIEKITPWEALVAELKFAVNIFAITKPVKIAKSSNSSINSKKGGLDGTSSTA